MDLQQITYEVTDRVATITLNRPDKLNAFTSRMVHEVCAAFDAADADGDVRAVIVTGAGRAFCAGADMSAGASTFQKTNTEAPESRSRGERSSRSDQNGEPQRSTGSVDKKQRDGGGIVSLRIFKSLKPVIAAINGAAVGVGSTMTLPMDIRLASTDARMGFVFTQRGITLEAASSWFLPRVVGMSQALEWSMTGRVFDAEEARAGGLVSAVHDPDDLLPAARELAAEIAESTSPVAVAMNRQLLWRMWGEPHPMGAHRVESRAVPQLGASADVAEGITSFFEKRPAEFASDPATEMPPVYPWFDEPEFE
ncbi:MAG: crotonase/enoyl-CoA hydratase family protein [Acidimicrobiales bacterium]